MDRRFLKLQYSFMRVIIYGNGIDTTFFRAFVQSKTVVLGYYFWDHR